MCGGEKSWYRLKQTTAFSCRFVYVCMTFGCHQILKGELYCIHMLFLENIMHSFSADIHWMRLFHFLDKVLGKNFELSVA